MKSARILSLISLVVLLIANEWAFRAVTEKPPIDSFLRMMMLGADVLVICIIIWLWNGNQSFAYKLKNTVSLHPKRSSLFIGLCLSFGLLLTVEFSSRYYFKHLYKAPYKEATYWEPSASIQDSILGTALLKDTVISHAYVVNDSLIYKQYYRTDELGRRITPNTHPDSLYSDFVMVTGCSFAFGYGLSETETLSYYLDSISRKRGYNYGVAGHGTQQTLALLQSRELKEEIVEQNGVLIHLFIDDHIPRLIGSRRLIKLWARNFPYYFLDGDSLRQDGTFWTGRHWLTRFYRAISQSAFIDLFDIDIPWYVSDAHLELFGAVLKTSEEVFHKQYPNGKFLVVIGPNSKLAPRIYQELKADGIEVLDLSQLLDKEDKQYKIHWTEGHPNGNYYREIAEEIDRYLQN